MTATARVIHVHTSPTSQRRNALRQGYVNIHRQVEFPAIARSTLASAAGWYFCHQDVNRRLLIPSLACQGDHCNPIVCLAIVRPHSGQLASCTPSTTGSASSSALHHGQTPLGMCGSTGRAYFGCRQDEGNNLPSNDTAPRNSTMKSPTTKSASITTRPTDMSNQRCHQGNCMTVCSLFTSSTIMEDPISSWCHYNREQDEMGLRK